MTMRSVAAHGRENAKCRRTHSTLTVANTHLLVLCNLRFLVGSLYQIKHFEVQAHFFAIARSRGPTCSQASQYGRIELRRSN
jgi:hypothetical protein